MRNSGHGLRTTPDPSRLSPSGTPHYPWDAALFAVRIIACGMEMRTMNRWLTAVIDREGDGYVSLCPELDIASQGDTIEEARSNLVEALELFFEVADPAEIANRLPRERYVTQIEVEVG
jgi:predicted RNase H-like HicB family nuclease